VARKKDGGQGAEEEGDRTPGLLEGHSAMESEECEDWLLESIKLYNDLHDFALQEATRVIEWTGEKSACAVCSHDMVAPVTV
ncbi:hypothetical protein GDO78_014805, partial [Eleutherodactylus coqui]